MPNEEVRIRNLDCALSKAAELFLTYGIEGTTKEMIARSAGLSIRSIDRYFIKKEDAVMQTAIWLGNHVWREVNDKYPAALFEKGRHTGSQLLEMYMIDLKKLFLKEPRLFVFYSEFTIYFSRHSQNRQQDCEQLAETVGSRYLAEKMVSLGKQDGSLRSDIDPKAEAVYFTQAYFSFLSHMALTYDLQAEAAVFQIDKYIARMMFVYRGERDLARR